MIPPVYPSGSLKVHVHASSLRRERVVALPVVAFGKAQMWKPNLYT